MTSRQTVAAAGFLAAALLISSAGCGGSGRPATHRVTGKVMFKKTTPAAGALVVFHPVDLETEKRIGGKPFAKVKDDGTFELTTYVEGDGAPEGDYGVTVDWQVVAKDKKFNLAIGDGGGGGQAKLNPKYGNPQQPAFKATVKKGQPNEFAFDVD